MSETANDRPTFWTTGWLPNGFKVSFTIPTAADGAAAYQHALTFTNALRAAGFRLSEPGLEPGEESETIVTVMRREKSDGTPIVDFYPAWGAGGDEPFGTYKYVHKYMNNTDETGAFLAAAGFKSLDQIPLYDGQSPLKRTAGKRHAKETAVPTPFVLVRKQGAEKIGSDGQPYKPWELVRYAPLAAGQTPAQPKAQPAMVSDIQDAPKPDGAWEYDFQALMKDKRVIAAIDQSNHRAAAIQALQKDGWFDGCASLDEAVAVVIERPDKQPKAG